MMKTFDVQKPIRILNMVSVNETSSSSMTILTSMTFDYSMIAHFL